MIIDERYFTNPETYIAGIDTKSDGKPTSSAQTLISEIRAYILRLEPQFIQMLFGCEAPRILAENPQLKEYLAQPQAGTSVIAKYVYYYYSREHVTFNTVAGEKFKNSESSSRASLSHRLTRLWNNMVDECWQIINSIDEVEINPDFNADIFVKINQFNL